MLSPNVVPGTKVVGVDNPPSDHKVVRPQWWWLLEKMEADGALTEHDHAGHEFTVLSVHAEHKAVSGFVVMFLETGQNKWPLEWYQELQPRPAVRLDRRVLEPA